MAKDSTAKAVTETAPAAPEAPKLLDKGPLTALPKPQFGKDTVPYENYRHPATTQEKLPIREGFDDSIYQWRRFNVEELHALNGSMQCGYWIPVHISLDYLDYNMHDDVFVPVGHPESPWDADGYISSGGTVKTGNGRECKEKYLCVRPMQVYIAEQALRAEMSKFAANAKTPADMAQLAKGADASRGTRTVIPNPSDPNNPYVQPAQPQDKVFSTSGWAQLQGGA